MTLLASMMLIARILLAHFDTFWVDVWTLRCSLGYFYFDAALFDTADR
jgi:hypothetical protein